MDEIIEELEEYEDVQFLVSLDYSTNEADLYSCEEWTSLYSELGDFNNNPLILNGDPDHHIWNMFAGSTYSAYAFIDHNMVLRYKFDMPNLYDFQYTYLPSLIDAMYGCTDSNACNYDIGTIYDDGSCQYGDECNLCEDVATQLDCMAIEGCMWMGNHCMSGSNCTDPIAYNYNPIADLLGDGDDLTCQYSSFINFGCIYEDAINFNPEANVDDGSCEYMFADLNGDGIINIIDIVQLVNIILE